MTTAEFLKINVGDYISFAKNGIEYFDHVSAIDLGSGCISTHSFTESIHYSELSLMPKKLRSDLIDYFKQQYNELVKQGKIDHAAKLFNSVWDNENGFIRHG